MSTEWYERRIRIDDSINDSRPYEWPSGERWTGMSERQRLDMSASLIEQSDEQRHSKFTGSLTLAQEKARSLFDMMNTLFPMPKGDNE